MDKCSQKVDVGTLASSQNYDYFYSAQKYRCYNNTMSAYLSLRVSFLVVAFPAAPTPSPTLQYPSVLSYLTGESHLTPDAVPGVAVEDLSNPAGTASLSLDSGPAADTQAVAPAHEQPDELLQKQLPRQIHIQQQLKLHFHPQNKSWRGTIKL